MTRDMVPAPEPGTGARGLTWSGLLGLGTAACGLLGIVIHGPAAISALAGGVGLQDSLSLAAPLLFGLLLVSGFGLVDASPWAATLVRTISVGLVIVTALGATGTYLLATSAEAPETAAAGWLLLGIELFAGIVWPLVLVGVLSASTARRRHPDSPKP